MRKIKHLVLVVALFATANTFAQSKSSSKAETTSLSVGVEAGLPLGDFGKGVSAGFGGSLKAAFPIFEGGAATLSAGYMTFSGKTIEGTTSKGPSLGLIPIKAGLRYRLSGDFYAEPQLGISIGKYSGEDQKSSSAFTYALGVGYLINNQIDLGIRYEAFSSSTVDDTGASKSQASGFVGLRVAYSFGL